MVALDFFKIIYLELMNSSILHVLPPITIKTNIRVNVTVEADADAYT
jgi:hypothetical protein